MVRRAGQTPKPSVPELPRKWFDAPSAYVATMTKAKRTGKIFIDYFRNDYTATAIADYGVRARPGAPVALPLEWKELDSLQSASQFSMKDVLERIRKKR